MRVYVALGFARDDWEVLGVFPSDVSARKYVDSWMKSEKNLGNWSEGRFDPEDFEITEHEVHEEES